MNNLTIYGNVGKDPEIKTVGDKKVARFSLATTRRFKDKDGNKVSDWHNVVLWGKLAELAEQYVKKGSSLIIEGEVQYRNYNNKEGQKVYMTEVVANQMHFVGKKETASNEITAKDEFQGGKQKTGAMSNVNELPQGNEDLSDLPF